MNQLDPSWDAEPKEALIRQGKVGSIFNVVGAKQINRLQRMAVEETRLGIPLVVARDVIHGYRTIYPIPLGQGATWNPELIEQAAQLTAKEAVSDGIRWAFSPMVDVAHDPRWGRVAEGYGEDPFLTSQMAAATVRGYHQLPTAPAVQPDRPSLHVSNTSPAIQHPKEAETITPLGFPKPSCVISICHHSKPLLTPAR